ncbi:MAG: cytidine deaminase [Planctomycetes bacterium]|nr:cytidine deaminase [Planctomycetota bacterium]
MKNAELINQAKAAMKNAYVPYSRFKVGAALLTMGNKVFTGSNIENASYGLTVCAERVAIFKAVSEGELKFKMMVIVTNSSKIAMPCGACLQVIAEFAPKLELILATTKGKYIKRKLSGLLPEAFTL